MDYCSYIYGLNIKSPWKFPGIPVVPKLNPDISIDEPQDLKGIEYSRKNWEKKERWFSYNVNPDGTIYLRWSGLFEILISRNGENISCFPMNGTPKEILFNYLLGQAISFAMLRKGIEPLHATSLVLDNKVISFAGNCGYGKSTLAASFLQAGYKILSDDLLVTDEKHGITYAYPGFPRIKLFPGEAARFLGKTRTDTPMNFRTDKQILKLKKSQSVLDPYPLETIYVLKRPYKKHKNPDLKINTLSKSSAYLSLTKNTFNRRVREKDRLKQQFSLCTKLVSRIKVKSLSYPRNIQAVGAVRDSILEDLSS